MIEKKIIHQPNLFDAQPETVELETVLLLALGEFQTRGKILANRELPLDRLRGAFKRASDKLARAEFSDAELAQGLEKLGSKVVKVPNFVAKHPFRVTVSGELADAAKIFYQKSIDNDPRKNSTN